MFCIREAFFRPRCSDGFYDLEVLCFNSDVTDIFDLCLIFLNHPFHLCFVFLFSPEIFPLCFPQLFECLYIVIIALLYLYIYFWIHFQCFLNVDSHFVHIFILLAVWLFHVQFNILVSVGMNESAAGCVFYYISLFL